MVTTIWQGKRLEFWGCSGGAYPNSGSSSSLMLAFLSTPAAVLKAQRGVGTWGDQGDGRWEVMSLSSDSTRLTHMFCPRETRGPSQTLLPRYARSPCAKEFGPWPKYLPRRCLKTAVKSAWLERWVELWKELQECPEDPSPPLAS